MLYKPQKNSFKGENGKLLVIGGSKDYSGAAILSLKTAVKFSDIVVFYPAEYDEFLINSIKTSVPEVIISKDLMRSLKFSDSILFGVGMSRSLFNFNLLKNSGKKVVVDADGLNLIRAPLSNKFLITPNKKELLKLQSFFSTASLPQLSKLLDCIILSKGPVNKIVYKDKVEEVSGGNAGLTKAGTGDVLAGIIASLSTKNSLWDSAFYGLRALLDASSYLFKQKSYYYSASELIDMLSFSISKS